MSATVVKGNSTLVKARFGPGMLLQHDDLEQLTAYTQDLSRLMFRSFFGCGVICGLVVGGEEDKCGKLIITVRAGVALDRVGDPIHVPTDQKFQFDVACRDTSELWIVLCGTTKRCQSRASMCAHDEDQPPSVSTRERDGYEIRLVTKWPECSCGCKQDAAPQANPAQDEGSADKQGGNEHACLCADPSLDCYKDHYDGKCACGCSDDCECGCDCVVLASLSKPGDGELKWKSDHRVRRFIRPVLMRDPQVEIEQNLLKDAKKETTQEIKEQAVQAAAAKYKAAPKKQA